MRTLLRVSALALLLAGCTSGDTWIWGEEATSHLHTVMQSGPGGRAGLLAEAGRFTIPTGRLEDARTALFTELAAASADPPWFLNPTPELMESGEHEIVVEFEPAADDVVLYAAPRLLEVTYPQGVLLVRRIDDIYSIGLRDRTGGPDPDSGCRVDVKATLSLDRAWDALERAALAVAVPPTSLNFERTAPPATH